MAGWGCYTWDEWIRWDGQNRLDGREGCNNTPEESGVGTASQCCGLGAGRTNPDGSLGDPDLPETEIKKTANDSFLRPTQKRPHRHYLLMSYSKTSSQARSSYVLLKNAPTDIMSYSKTSSQTLSSYVPLKNVLTDIIFLPPTQKRPHRHDLLMSYSKTSSQTF